MAPSGLPGTSDRHWFLRNRSAYHPRVYYAIVLADLALRCAWLVPFTRPPESSRTLEAAAWAFGAAEVSRRVLWNILRVENEHATNCGRFRATRSVPLDVAPDAAGASDKNTRLRAPSACAVVARACCPAVATLEPGDAFATKALLGEEPRPAEGLELPPAPVRRRALT